MEIPEAYSFQLFNKGLSVYTVFCWEPRNSLHRLFQVFEYNQNEIQNDFD